MMCSTNDRISILCQFECELTTRFARNEFLQHFVLSPSPPSPLRQNRTILFGHVFMTCLPMLGHAPIFCGKIVHWLGFTSDSPRVMQNRTTECGLWWKGRNLGGGTLLFVERVINRNPYHICFLPPSRSPRCVSRTDGKIGVEKRNMADSYHFPSPKKRQPTLSMQIENVYTHKSSRLFCDCHLFTGIIRCDKSLSAFYIYKAWLQRYTDHSPWN